MKETNCNGAGLKKPGSNNHLIASELLDYKYALDQSAIVAITDQKGIIVYVNENFCRISKYSEGELIGQDHRIINSNFHSPSYIKDFWSTIANGNVWRGEFRNKAKDGTLYWVDTTVVPFLNEKGKPYQYLSIRYDITDKKRLENLVADQKKKAQIKLIAKTLEVQEKERSAIGMELHDNANQILVATKIMLSILLDTETKNGDLIADCMRKVQSVIDENRRIAHELVTPSFEKQSLVCRVSTLLDEMFQNAEIEVYFNSDSLRESLLSDQQKLAIYRIVQEQCLNIIKYADAKQVKVIMIIENRTFNMIISDDGNGMDPVIKSTGIGFANINTRLKILNGTSSIQSQPGKGLSLEVRMPVSNT